MPVAAGFLLLGAGIIAVIVAANATKNAAAGAQGAVNATSTKVPGASGKTTTGLPFPSGSKTGKVSWFGGSGDPTAGSQTASGAPVSEPGIAVYDQATLGGWWLMRAPNGREFVVKQTDIGPAPWTGRLFDFTYSLLPLIGYTTSNFPTDSQVTGYYLGKTVPPQYAGYVI